ncbi:hypothetical protein Lalb_Chr10g0095631 [Lupinus albus]|uniref:Uncharacterized protein n=1 Tax=Lupinus albus TaxID=3870 RepID=A0A6A4PUX0_LUPAL|nr:hypothetical protein Lalb_Chr10g0095631 [Lupinus albus]
METMAMEKTIVPRVLFNGDNGGSAVRTCFESGASGDDKGYTMFHLQQLWVHVEDVLQFSSHLDFSCVFYLKQNSTGKLEHA